MQVSVRDNNVDQALRALKKKLQREGVFREMKLKQHFEKPSVKKAREKAEAEAINVFGDNLKDLLLAAPAGGKATMGLDPGIRTGVKVAVVDATGKVLGKPASRINTLSRAKRGVAERAISSSPAAMKSR